MGKLLVLLVGAAISSSVWFVRRGRARTRLRELDEGKRCVSCHGNDIRIEPGDIAACQRCGHRAALAALRGAVLSEQDIAHATKPHNPSH